MATKNTGGANRSRLFKPEAFVSALVRDVKKPPRLRAVRGYIGESSEKDHVRVYLDVALRRFVDIPTDGVVHAEEIPKSVIPLGAVYLWVNEDAKIRHYGNWAAPEDPTTMATGEEGDGGPTTMATGEEGMGIENPLDLVVNPFGRF